MLDSAREPTPEKQAFNERSHFREVPTCKQNSTSEEISRLLKRLSHTRPHHLGKDIY